MSAGVSRRGSCCFCRHSYYGPIDRRRCGNNWLSVSFRSSARTCGNAEGSTLRLTLGCLLAGELGLELRRGGSGGRLTFCDGEARLSGWLAENALVTWRRRGGRGAEVGSIPGSTLPPPI